MDIELRAATEVDTVRELFAEELGAVLQVAAGDVTAVLADLRAAGLDDCVTVIGRVVADDVVRIRRGTTAALATTRTELRRLWSATSHEMQSLRDHPDCAREEYACMTDPDDPGPSVH